jgi:hypothetical protein
MLIMQEVRIPLRPSAYMDFAHTQCHLATQLTNFSDVDQGVQRLTVYYEGVLSAGKNFRFRP